MAIPQFENPCLGVNPGNRKQMRWNESHGTAYVRESEFAAYTQISWAQRQFSQDCVAYFRLQCYNG